MLNKKDSEDVGYQITEDNDEMLFLTSTSLGIDPVDLELGHLVEYINQHIRNFCISPVS